jgi:hypothetical protein
MPSLFDRPIQDHPRVENHFVVQVEDWNNEMIGTRSTAHAKVMGIETGEKGCSFPSSGGSCHIGAARSSGLERDQRASL